MKLEDKILEHRRLHEMQPILEGVTSFFESLSKDYGFEERLGQKLLSFDITKAIITNKCLIGEAGVGIGKSFAYIVPLLFYNQQTEKPVVIATSTIALQEQVVSDIKTISDMIDYHPEIVNTKGQNHFICRKRAEQYFGKSEKPSNILLAIRDGADERKDFTMRIDNRTWNNINVNGYNSESCYFCKYASECEYRRIRVRMEYTNGIIVCNQDLLLANQEKLSDMRRGLINSDVDVIVIDEAHNLEGKVRNLLTKTISKSSILALLKKVILLSDLLNIREGQLADILNEEHEAVAESADLLFSEFENQIQLQIYSNTLVSEDSDRFAIQVNSNTEGAVAQLRSSIIDFQNRIEQLMSHYRVRQNKSLNFAFGELRLLVGYLWDVVEYNKEADYLLWLEKHNNQISVSKCPKEIDFEANEMLFDNYTPTILVSATLANTTEGSLNEQYGYLIRNVGFPKDKYGMLSKPKPSPFPYNQNAMIYYASDLPHPTRFRDEFVKQATQRLIELLKMSNGKALVLFTAKSDLSYVYSELKKNDLLFEILSQSEKGSQKEIIRKFKNDEDSVLLATGSFWEGISIEGKPLSHLIIFRLPFPVPDPIIDYKCSIAENPLMDVQVPEMVIKLKQGVGRLIRKETDKGIVPILDPRLGNSFKNQYKDLIWDALPMKNKTDSLTEIKEFYTTVVSDQDDN